MGCLPRTLALRARRRVPWLSVVLACTVLACRERPPSERVHVVTAPRSPGLAGFSSPKKDSPASDVVRQGDVLLLDPASPKLKHLDWTGDVDGERMTRSAEPIGVRRAPGDARVFVFAPDVGPEIDVPAGKWMCEELRRAAAVQAENACEARLRRIRFANGRVVGFEPCAGPACPIIVASGASSEVWTTKMEGLTEARLAVLGGAELLLLSTRWVEGTARSGGKLGVYRVAVGLEPVADLALDEVDARDPVTTKSRTGALRVEPDAIRFAGTLRTVARDTAVETSAAPVEDIVRFGPGGTRLQEAR